MASQPVMEAAARESRANAREDMAVLTSGAREKVDNAMATMQALGQTLLHPMDKKKKEDAQAAAQERKKVAREKRDEIRSVSAQQASTERVSARNQVAKGVSETGGTRYPVLSADQPQQAASPHAGAPAHQPGHPPITDKPLGSHGESPVLPHADESAQESCYQNAEFGGWDTATHEESSISPHAHEHAQEPRNQSLELGGSDTTTAAPEPVPALSRESKSGEHAQAGGTEGVEDADYYPSPRIVQT